VVTKEKLNQEEAETNQQITDHCLAPNIACVSVCNISQNTHRSTFYKIVKGYNICEYVRITKIQNEKA